MGRTFAYCRVSTLEQTVENQKIAIESAGFRVPENRVIAETVSGSCQAMQRKGFQQLIDHKMESGDTLVILKLDRLGRDMIDVMETLHQLSDRGISVISLDLGAIDLTSPAGKLQVQVMAAVAEFERNRIRERTKEGLTRAKAEGKKLGRPKADAEKIEAVKDCRQNQGLSIAQTAEKLGISVATVKRLQKAA